MINFPLYYIEWTDSHSLAESGWKTMGQLEQYTDEPFVIRDVGFIIKETKHYICLVGGHNVDDEDVVICGHREIKIPIKCILKRVQLKIPNRKR